MLEKDIQEVLFSQQQLEERVSQIAQEITRDYAGQEIVLISVLRGLLRVYGRPVPPH